MNRAVPVRGLRLPGSSPGQAQAAMTVTLGFLIRFYGGVEMTTVNDVFKFIDTIAPVKMKMEFDNVGFLVGRGEAELKKILVSLDVTSDAIEEASDIGAGLIVSHHPMFFSLKSVTDADTTGKKIVQMLSRGIAAICMHTNLDAARGGVNDVLAAKIGISREGEPAEMLVENEGALDTGETFSYGMIGRLAAPTPMQDFMAAVKKALGVGMLRYHDSGHDVSRVAIVGGSGGNYFDKAVARGCDTFLTADIKYDNFLEAKELGINLIDADHFCTENVVIAPLAEKLQAAFPEIDVRVSGKHGPTVKFY